MTCSFCQFSNSDDEHRCRRCGRRWQTEPVEASTFRHDFAGANALAVQPSFDPSIIRSEPLYSRAPSQRALFSELAPKVIPFDSGNRALEDSLVPKSTVTRPRRPAPVDPDQGSLDFLAAAPQGPRKLKTQVEAVIYCDSPVATPMHRFIASVLDASMILIGFGIFLSIFILSGGVLVWTRVSIITMSAAFACIAMLYGLIWAIAGSETLGMRWTHLRLVNFDGMPLDGRARALRMAGTWLGFCSGTIGLLWALVDEENLTWHDHMSKTFPTIQESNTSFFRRVL